MKKFLAFILCAVLVCATVPFTVSAAGTETVVYLDSMAEGNGSGTSPENAVATLEEAFALLDLSKDCTIVVSGYFCQFAHFIPTEAYTGSVTITSVYNGVDYRKTNEAVFESDGYRYFCAGATTFDNLNFNMSGSFYLVIAQNNPFTLGEGFENTIFGNTTGLKFGNAFSILGGYQGADCFYNADESKDVNITVKSGDYILIGAWNRQSEGVQRGKATINIEGDAHVCKFYASSVNKNDLVAGDVVVNLKDQAKCDIVYGAVNPNMGCIVNSLTFNWLGGDMYMATPLDGSAEGLEAADIRTTYTNGYKLVYSDAVANHENFASISAAFEKAEKAGAAPADTTAPVVTEAPTTTAAPVVTDAPVVTTAAPVVTEPTVTTAAPTQAEPTPSTGDASIMVVFAAAAVVCLAAVVVIKKREN